MLSISIQSFLLSAQTRPITTGCSFISKQLNNKIIALAIILFALLASCLALYVMKHLKLSSSTQKPDQEQPEQTLLAPVLPHTDPSSNDDNTSTNPEELQFLLPPAANSATEFSFPLPTSRSKDQTFAMENGLKYKETQEQVMKLPLTLPEMYTDFDFVSLGKQRMLASGTSKHVYKLSNNHVAIMGNGGLRSEWTKELRNARFITQIASPYILKYVGIANKGIENKEILIAEYCPKALFVITGENIMISDPSATHPFSRRITDLEIDMDKTIAEDAMRKNKYINQLSLAVYAMHSHGFCHGDIKLDNILIAEDGNIRLCDFDKVESLATISKKEIFERSLDDVRALANVIITLEGGVRVFNPESQPTGVPARQGGLTQEESDAAIDALLISPEKKQLLLKMTRYEREKRMDIDEACAEIAKLWKVEP